MIFVISIDKPNDRLQNASSLINMAFNSDKVAQLTFQEQTTHRLFDILE